MIQPTIPGDRSWQAPLPPHLPPPPPPPPVARSTPSSFPPARRRDPKKCPDGWIPLVVAENKLNNEAVLARLQEGAQGAPLAVMNYTG